MLKRWNYRSFEDRLQSKLKQYSLFENIKINKEFYLLCFFCFLFIIIISRLFFLQIINHKSYDDLLSSQQVNESILKADRWNIFADDRSEKHIQLTENITMYNLTVDPKFIRDKKRFIELITPVVYKHFCEINGMKEVERVDCVKNIEKFTNKQLLPIQPEFFYYGSGIVSSWYFTFDWTWYNIQIDQVLSWFSQNIAFGLIKDALDQKIYVWIKKKNYLWFFSNTAFLSDLKKLDLSYIDIQYNNYVYILPRKSRVSAKEIAPLKKLLDRYGYLKNLTNIENLFSEKENRYVKIISDTNPIIIQMIKDLKSKYARERSNEKIPILHWLWVESYAKRYYQYWSFLSNILWFVDKWDKAFYGIEEYFDNVLKGKDGKIIWRSSSWIWPIWANEFQIEDVQDGNDVYLTIDIWVQKEVETIVKKYYEIFKADSISVLVYDPVNWHVKASVNYPSFNPNDYNEVFETKPLSPKEWYIVDNLTYIDVPVYIKTGWETRLAKSFERSDTTLPKYIAKNTYWPQVLVDKNISMPYEPGSIMKAFTVWIWLDTDEMRFYDIYNDPWKVKVWPYEIKNADDKCTWNRNFLHAFVYSCNVGMVRIVQKLWEEIFYNYIDKLWFGKLTNIELANESEWFIEWASTVSLARFLNNAFWQWLLTTPIQIAAWYWSLVNWGYYVKPTIIKWIYDKKTKTFYENKKKVVKQIFRKETSDAVRLWLFNVLDQNPELKYGKVEWYDLWGKSWTSQISYKGKYQFWIWWTNGSFVWLITRDDPKYIVIVQIRRPRSSLWWWQTAGKIFWDVAKFLISYSLID